MVRASISEPLAAERKLSRKRNRWSDDGAKRVDTEGKRRSLDLDILDYPMEWLLESALFPCPNAKFGCTKEITHGNGVAHEKECSFSPCSCPLQDCYYTGSYKDLFHHYNSTHLVENHMIHCGVSFQFQMKISDGIFIIRESLERLLFVVQCFRDSFGVYVTINCIAPSAPKVGDFSFRLSCLLDGLKITYISPKVERIQKVSFQIPDEDFILIPTTRLHGELLEMELLINNNLNQQE